MGSNESNDTPQLSLGDVALAWLGVSLVILISRVFDLGLGSKLVIASVRTFVQLSILGLMLQPIIDNGSLLLVLALTVAMVLIAAFEAVNRLTHTYEGIMKHAVFSITFGPVINAIAMLVLVVDCDPLWNPQYAIPLLGMLLGNCLTAASLGLGETMTRIAGDGGDNIELLLARGATLIEASRPIAAAALSKGLLPTINSMSVIGLVTIPGMMTGQLLGGADPIQASRYQIVIMYYIVASSCFTLLLSTMLAMSSLTDQDGRLRRDRLSTKHKGKDIVILSCRALKRMLFLGWDLVASCCCSQVPYNSVDEPQEQPENSANYALK
eukprot:TRINITY_DN853_c0_g1_i10.p1 TRINITY_DN853_c0_g1~~TRINITY_DN853_c0_g1_i10.p1  ORF type:complete len:325 (-),score=56.22 TRINITY_DN853_c0_g1_i10:199-1173(-)